MQNKGNPFRANASLAMGEQAKLDAALKAAVALFGTDRRKDGRDAPVFDVVEEMPLSNLHRMNFGAVVCLNPEGPDEWGKANSYKDGYKKDRKTGVARLSPTETVYIIPPPPPAGSDREEIYKRLEFAGLPRTATPGHAMLGLIVTEGEGFGTDDPESRWSTNRLKSSLNISFKGRSTSDASGDRAKVGTCCCCPVS